MESKTSDIIYYANEFGPLTHKHLCDLTGMHEVSLWRKLPQMVHAKQLYCAPQGMHRPNVYATYNIVRRADFTHDLARADVATALKQTGLLTYWWQSREKLSRETSVNEDGRFELSVELSDKIASFPYFLEVDIGSEGYRQIEDKFKRYLARPERGQVLFVIKFDPLRSHRTNPGTLAQLAQKFLDRQKPQTWKTFLFATLEDFTTQPLGPICHIVHDSAKYPILPRMRM
jgi:hypothetical protein